jgi:hypothetical protein
MCSSEFMQARDAVRLCASSRSCARDSRRIENGGAAEADARSQASDTSWPLNAQARIRVQIREHHPPCANITSSQRGPRASASDRHEIVRGRVDVAGLDPGGQLPRDATLPPERQTP